MPDRTGGRRLGTVALLTGAASLATEICASRLLAPYFGNSTIVWACVIGLMLVALAVGSRYGGRIADKHPHPETLGGILALAAVTTAILPFIARPVLGTAVQALNGFSAGAVIATFVGTLVLFAVPATLTGMVPAFVFRLALTDAAAGGALAGRLYALSTAGAIGGTFGSALVGIPTVGTQHTLLAAAALLACAAALLAPMRAVVVAFLTALLALVPPGVVKQQPGLIADRESSYQYIQVLQSGKERDLELNEGLAVHSVWRADTVLTGGEWDMFLVAPALLDRPVKRVLVIGNAGGTTARAYSHFYPDADIDGVEIDPAVTDAGRTYLGLGDNPRLTVHDADGRPFLELSKEHWDIIVVDAYRQPYIPFQLATVEFFQLCRDHLSPGGLLTLNVERIPGNDALTTTVESTVSAVMPHSWRWPAMKFNEMLVAVNSDSNDRPIVRRTLDPDIAVLGRLFDSQTVAADRSHTPMTDDRAPIEWLTDRSLLEFIASGGVMDEPGLPTRPH